MKQRLQDDVKAAMLAGDSLRLETLRGLKSVILYAEVAAGKREEGLTDDEILALFSKEAKKRQESAELYIQGGAQEKADKPAGLQQMGQVIGQVKSKVGNTADGSLIAKLVKEKLS